MLDIGDIVVSIMDIVFVFMEFLFNFLVYIDIKERVIEIIM